MNRRLQEAEVQTLAEIIRAVDAGLSVRTGALLFVDGGDTAM